MNPEPRPVRCSCLPRRSGCESRVSEGGTLNSFLGWRWLAISCVAFCVGWTFAGPALRARHPPRPSYSEPVPPPPGQQTRVWRYIVIHHTGSSQGNEETIQQDHLHRGMENGMAYHFLIGNGSMSLGDGMVVEGHRWKHQLQGGHCHQDYLNECGIGICLVGNFNRKPPTPRQLQALAQLLLTLQARLHIPDDNVHGHGQFFGEDSDCPGRFFSWESFWTQVNLAYSRQRAVMAPVKGMSVSLRNARAPAK